MKSKQKIFYGWWILVGAFILNFSSLGILVNTLGVFVRPVTESLGFARGAFIVYFSIGAISMMVMAPIIGKLLERYDIRIIMTLLDDHQLVYRKKRSSHGDHLRCYRYCWCHF
jgi:hypothetical protein